MMCVFVAAGDGVCLMCCASTKHSPQVTEYNSVFITCMEGSLLEKNQQRRHSTSTVKQYEELRWYMRTEGYVPVASNC